MLDISGHPWITTVHKMIQSPGPAAARAAIRYPLACACVRRRSEDTHLAPSTWILATVRDEIDSSWIVYL